MVLGSLPYLARFPSKSLPIPRSAWRRGVTNTPTPWAWGSTPPGAYPQLDLGSGAHSNKTNKQKDRISLVQNPNSLGSEKSLKVKTHFNQNFIPYITTATVLIFTQCKVHSAHQSRTSKFEGRVIKEVFLCYKMYNRTFR